MPQAALPELAANRPAAQIKHPLAPDNAYAPTAQLEHASETDMPVEAE